MEIEKDKTNNVINKLKQYGKVQQVSIFMNIYGVVGKHVPVHKIENLDGVLSVQEDIAGSLMPCMYA